MSAPGAARLYTPELLALAVELANYPYDPALPLKGEAHSRICGSRLNMGASAGDDGRIEAIGLRVTACAVGQASAAIFAAGAVGQTGSAICASLAEIEMWLSGSGDLPGWPGISALSLARDHPGRHGAILLPWKAAAAVLCKAEQAG